MHETWSYSWAVRNIIAELLMPPGIWILLAAIAFIAFQHRKKLQTIALFLPLIMLWITSTTCFSQQFAKFVDNYLNWQPAVQLEDVKSALQLPNQESIAIVILGAGVRRGALDNGEYQNQDVSKDVFKHFYMTLSDYEPQIEVRATFNLSNDSFFGNERELKIEKYTEKYILPFFERIKSVELLKEEILKNRVLRAHTKLIAMNFLGVPIGQ
jgi:hypothetical protein